MSNYMEPRTASRWQQREGFRENGGSGYMTVPEQDEHMMALYDAAVQLDGMAQLVALQNRLDAENTMLAMNFAASLAEQETRYSREYPNREPEFRKYLQDYVIRSSGRIGGGRR